MKRVFALFLVCIMVLTGCNSGGYDDASVDPPENWASYTVGELQFRFEAGWKSGNWDPLQNNMDAMVNTIGAANNLALFGRLVAPASDRGTVNYVDFGYWDTGRTFEASELEGIMEQINDLSLSLKKMGVSSEDKQSSRIRVYGRDALTALTVSYLLETDSVSCLMQVALVPHGTRVYLISYADFSKQQDDTMLEQLLTTLSFAQ